MRSHTRAVSCPSLSERESQLRTPAASVAHGSSVIAPDASMRTTVWPDTRPSPAPSAEIGAEASTYRAPSWETARMPTALSSTADVSVPARSTGPHAPAAMS